MRFQGALIKEQGITFAVVIVQKHVLNSSQAAAGAIQSFQPHFPGTPVILMAQDSRGVPSYYGRKDIAKFMANIPVSAVPWKNYTLN